MLVVFVVKLVIKSNVFFFRGPHRILCKHFYFLSSFFFSLSLITTPAWDVRVHFLFGK